MSYLIAIIGMPLLMVIWVGCSSGLQVAMTIEEMSTRVGASVAPA